MEEAAVRRKEKIQVAGMTRAELAAAEESDTEKDADEDADDDDGSGSRSSSDCYSSSSQMGVEKVSNTSANKKAVAKKTPKASASALRTPTRRVSSKAPGEKRDPSPSHSDATSSARVAEKETILTAASDFCNELQKVSSMAIWKGDFSSNVLETRLKKTLSVMQEVAAFIDKLSVDDPSELRDHAQQVHVELTQESERLFKVKDISATVKGKGVALQIGRAHV